VKSLIFGLILTLVSFNASAMSKNCEGANNDSNTKGVTFTAQITQKSVDIGDDGPDVQGSYPFSSKANTVAGKDGKTYLN
jgi:hypothetical protein